MARRYDTRSTIFSPEGRLYQVEYALEAISSAGTCIGILTKEVHDRMCCAVAGLTSDANVLISDLRAIAKRYELVYREQVPCDYLVSQLCNLKHAYTQFGGKRPFGVSFLYAGYDKYRGYQLFQSDPSGNYSGWKAYAIGYNSTGANSYLRQEYKYDEMTLDRAKVLAVRSLYKAVDTSKLKADKCECVVLAGKGEIFEHINKEEIESHIEEYEKFLKEQEDTAKESSGGKHS
ncbi:hypothetical protein ACOME3_006463 [Neoechinorhynchus agilis]